MKVMSRGDGFVKNTRVARKQRVPGVAMPSVFGRGDRFEFGRHEAGDVEPHVVGCRAEDSYVDDIQDNASGSSENDVGAIDPDFANDVYN
jgi:hypothetical protein